MSGACRTEQHARSVRCVFWVTKSKHTVQFSFVARLLKINCERRSLFPQQTELRRNAHKQAPLNSLLAPVEIIIQPALKSPRKHVVRSYVLMLQGGSDFDPAGLPVSENRFFILASLPTDRVFSNILFRHCDG